MSEIQDAQYVWMDGELVPRADAKLPISSAAVFYATNVFEGLRAYWNDEDEELYCFRAQAHFDRLRESMKMMRFSIPYSDADLYDAVRDVLQGNDSHQDVHMHMVACVLGSGQDATTPTSLYINPHYRGRMTGPGTGLACCVSNWARTSDNAIPIRLKCGANYQNARLALLQAKADGYDSPIFLTQRGKVAEGVGASLFLVRKGKLITPTTSNDILESITRTTLLEDVIPDVLGLEVVERDVDRTELYVADEIFFCGSGYEITPITSVDRLPVGDGQVGPITQRVFDTYLALVRGEDKRYPQWRTPTYHKIPEAV